MGKKRRWMILMIAVTLLASLTTANVALAQEPALPSQQGPYPRLQRPLVQQQPFTLQPQMQGSERPVQRQTQPVNANILILVAETLDITPGDLLSELETGKTVVEIAEAQGVDLDTLIAAITEPLVERLNQAVEDEKLSQEEADERLAAFQERLQEWAEKPVPARFLRIARAELMAHGVAEAHRAILEGAASALDMTLEEYHTALREGNTLWQLAEETDISRSDILAQARAAFDETLQSLVEDELVSQEQADQMMERLTDKALESTAAGMAHPQGKQQQGRLAR